MNKENKNYLILLITAGSLFVIIVILLLILSATGFFNGREFIEAVLVSAAIILGAFFAISLFVFLNHQTVIKTLKIENEGILGKKSTFNNAYIFQKRAMSIAKYRGNQKQHIIAFSFSNLVVSQNVNRNAEIFNLNSHIVDYLEGFYKVVNARSNDFIFGYTRGAFLIFAFKQNEQSIQKIADLISEEIYNFASKECRHVWVQPFFGINKISKEATITSDVEDAMIARSHSEKNIESFTYFLDSFREGDSLESNEISEALEKDEFVPFYQAKYSLKEHRFISAEVLARWKSPKYGLVGPSKFIDKAEKSGVLNAIDIRIFQLAVRDLGENIKRGRRVLPISVNFSLYEFFSRNFLELITKTLEQYHVSPSLLEIEITETTSQVNKFLSLSVIRKLKEMGIRVLMDDFWVGYSQIDNLQQIPFDASKIDKSFTNKITEDAKTRSIVKYLIELAHTNDMEVIVEGAETKEQIDILRRFKVDTVQGFYFTRPLSLAGYNELIKENKFEKKGVKK